MNILVTCSYWYYADFSMSFVHAQAKAYAAAGQHVRVLIPLPLGSRRLPEGAVKLSPLLHRLDLDGVEIYYLTTLSLSNFGSRRFGGRSLNTQTAICTLHSQLKLLTQGFRPDIVHAHTFGYGSEMGAWLRQRLGCPLVVTTHGGDANTPLGEGNSAYIRSQCESANAVITVSSILAERIRACGVRPPVSTVYNGFHAEYIASAEKRRKSLIQVGNLVSSKHNSDTLRAVARLRERYPDIFLTVVGDGAERGRLEALTRELGLMDCVTFLGRLPNQETLTEMAKAEIFVMPSYPEGFGIVYLEAMASGCVTIGTKGEGIDGFIRDGENGFLVPPDDPDAIVDVIDWCLSHPAEADAIAQRGKADALALTWGRNAEQYIKLFEELMK